ncbi:MAG TPA: DJ-1/PfpI family protein [Blastocatellia bacterium]|nr:DJ-1/PfpI family protein [Blastocatellia bacterium]
MRIAIVTFDGFNEIDSFVASHILNRVDRAGWKAEIAAPAQSVTSMNGVTVSAQQPLEFLNEADAVIIGSGRKTRQAIIDESIISRIRLSPERQLIGSQCSGALVLAHLGYLKDIPACTDVRTRPMLEAAGVRVLDRPFHAEGNIASAGGCLSAQYLATWMIWRLAGKKAAVDALSYVMPVGEQSEYIARAIEAVSAYVGTSNASAGAAMAELS